MTQATIDGYHRTDLTESILQNIDTEPEVLRCGTYLSDDNYLSENEESVRIRIINYNDKIYYHKMISGECVEFRLLSK